MTNNSKPADLAQKIIDDAGGSKVSFASIDKVNIYLPPMFDVASSLQLPSNKKEIIELVENEYKKKLKISRTAKYDLAGKGVGAHSIRKIFSWVAELPISFKVLMTKSTWRYLTKTLKNNSNAGIWQIAITGYLNAFSKHSNESFIELTPMFQFIEERCNADNTFLSNAKHDIKEGLINVEDNQQCWEHASKLWANKSHVPEEQIASFTKYSQLIGNNNLDKQQKLAFFESYFYLALDFHLEMMSHLELGCILYFDDYDQELSSSMGALGHAILNYALPENSNDVCCVGLLFDELKIRIDKLSPNMSWSDIASFIEIKYRKNDDYVEDEVSIRKKKYALLKEWRSGKSRPSPSAISQFLDNLGKKLGEGSSYPINIYFRIALAIDNLPNEITKNLLASEKISKKEIETIVKKVLSRFPSYYAKNHEKYFSKVKQVV